MRDHDKETELILQIRNLAGQIGEINHSEQVGKSDAEDYDFKVLTGLANATVEVIDFDPGKRMQLNLKQSTAFPADHCSARYTSGFCYL
jgi:hypothetical protein